MDDQTGVIEVVQQKGFRKKLVVLATFEGKKERVSVEGSKVVVGSLEAYFALQSDAEAVSSFFRKDLRPALNSVAASSSAFLAAKGKDLAFVHELEKDPRGVLLKLSAGLPDDADPVEYLVAEAQRNLKAASDRLIAELDASSKELPEEIRLRMFAAVYAVGLFHDSVARGDQPSKLQALKLLSEASPGSYPTREELGENPPDDAAEALLRKSLDALASLG